MSENPATRSALVTGATRGIGRAIAERLVSDGVHVTGTGTSKDGKVPEGCAYRAVDFSDEKATSAFADEVANEKFDILVNNAGINKISPFADINPEDFNLIQRINVTAPFLLCRAIVPGMRARGYGRIVNISSIWGKIAKAHRGPYAASKFALDGMTVALAAEVAGDGVLANCVAPGFIDTELTCTILDDDTRAELAAQVPIGRFGTAEEIASFVVWLAGPENTYICGQNIAIDGGFARV